MGESEKDGVTLTIYFIQFRKKFRAGKTLIFSSSRLILLLQSKRGIWYPKNLLLTLVARCILLTVVRVFLQDHVSSRIDGSRSTFGVRKIA
jgi:hypothetical protein